MLVTFLCIHSRRTHLGVSHLIPDSSQMISQSGEDLQTLTQLIVVCRVDCHILGPSGGSFALQHVLSLLVCQLVLGPANQIRSQRFQGSLLQLLMV